MARSTFVYVTYEDHLLQGNDPGKAGFLETMRRVRL
jgi:hypothetical protein